jgi:hypothetical protein
VGTFTVPRADVDHLIDHLPLAVPLGPALAHTTGTPARLNRPAPSPAGTWDLTVRTANPHLPWQHAGLTPGDIQPALAPAAPPRPQIGHD